MTYKDQLDLVRVLADGGRLGEDISMDYQLALREVIERLDELEPKPIGTLPDPESVEGRVLYHAAQAVYLYGGSERRLDGELWDIIRILVPDLREDVEPEELAKATDPEAS